MVVTCSYDPHLWIGLILEHRLKTTSIISFHLWQRINVLYLLCLMFMTSPFDIDISIICSKLTQPCVRMCGKLWRNKDYRCFFLCTDWISQHPFRPLVFIDNRRVLRPRIPYCLTVVWVWSNKESVEYRRSRHHCVSRPQLDSANTRGLLSANPAFLQTCSDILWFLKWDFWFENLCSSQLNSACNVYEAGRTSSSASNFYSAPAFLPHSNSLSSQSSGNRFF